MKIAAASKSTIMRRPRFASTGVACALLVALSFLSAAPDAFGQATERAPQSQSGQDSQGRAEQVQSAQSGRNRSVTVDVAGAQLAPFFRAVRSQELQGEELPLERVLYGVYSPAERYRRLSAYWDLAGKNAYYNLCVTYSAYTTECATKIENQGAASQETQQLLTSVRQIALQRQTEARLRLLQSQYDFDAAFTTAAGRRAATARAAQSGARSLDATRGAVLYLPSGKPATDFFETRYEATARYRGATAEAARLNSLLPLLYETLQARANQTNRELDMLITLVKSAQVSELALFAALDRYLDAQTKTIDAAVRYNQAIAAYAAQTIPSSIQGAAFLATINQRPTSQTTRQSQRPNATPTTQNSVDNAPETGGAPQSPEPAPDLSYDRPRNLPNGLKESIVEATPSRTSPQTSEITPVVKPSDAAENQVASLASVQEFAPSSISESNPSATPATEPSATTTFALVGYTRPVTENPPDPLTSAAENANTTPMLPASASEEELKSEESATTQPEAVAEESKPEESGEYVIRGQEADNSDANSSRPSVDVAQNVVDSERVHALVNALFAVEPPKKVNRESGVRERLYTLHEVASRSAQSASGRYAVATTFWKLQGACARLRVEETIFQNYSVVYNVLVTQSGEDSDAGRLCLAAALGQQARVAEAKTVKRNAQLKLMKLMGLSPASASAPAPASLPFCGAKFELGVPPYNAASTRRSADVVKERVVAVQTLGAALDPPGRLLNIDANNVTATNVEVYVATLEKKRESALFFIDHVVRLNFSIAEYVAYFPARVDSEQFVDALVNRGN